MITGVWKGEALGKFILTFSLNSSSHTIPLIARNYSVKDLWKTDDAFSIFMFIFTVCSKSIKSIAPPPAGWPSVHPLNTYWIYLAVCDCHILIEANSSDTKMSKIQAKHVHCSSVGCKNQQWSRILLGTRGWLVQVQLGPMYEGWTGSWRGSSLFYIHFYSKHTYKGS